MKNKISDCFKTEKLEDIIGHSQLLKNNGLLSKINDNNYFSILLVGDPGIGKTSIINILANMTKLNKINYNAINDSRSILNELFLTHEKICLIIDEIHALSKDKQTILLKLLEENKIILFSSTTENPFVYLIPSLRSRINIFKLNKHENEIIDELYTRISKITTNNTYSLDDIKNLLIYNEYDIRSFLNQIDIIDANYKLAPNQINKKLLNDIGFNNNYVSGDDNNLLHDLKSALQKSIRGSDVNASLYYLAALIKNGNLKEIVRRLVIIAHEDISLANSNLCLRVSVGCEMAEKIGLPEAKIILSNLVIEMAMSQKSNSGIASIENALKYLDLNPIIKIPKHICYFNSLEEYKLSEAKYLNPHNFKFHYVNQQYLDPSINNIFYNYDFSNDNENKILKSYIEYINKNKRN